MNNKIKQRFINYWNSRSGVDYSTIPFTIEMLENGDLTWNIHQSNKFTSLSYAINNNAPVTVPVQQNTAYALTINNLSAGDKVKFNGISYATMSSDSNVKQIDATGNFNVYGNSMSLFYGDNFSDKTAFPDTTGNVLQSLFNQSKHIIDASNFILPALYVNGNGYKYMFAQCSNLLYAPKVLPATTNGQNVYMFKGCTSLISAPEIKLQFVDTYDCFCMFEDCTSLVIPPKYNFTDINTIGCIGMFKNCSKLSYAYDLPSTLSYNNCCKEMFMGCTSLTTAPALPATTLSQDCYYAMFKGCTSLTTAPALPAITVAQNAYREMFSGCTSLTTAPELPATTLANYCYSNMFKGCTSLTTAPKLPATNLANQCYDSMFSGCTSLTIAPELPATTLASSCYINMFNGCTSLTTAPELPATTSQPWSLNWYEGMFKNCTSLTTAPKLPATNLANQCYDSMFKGCTSLTTAPELPATTLANYCYSNMFHGCTALTTAPALIANTLTNNCYSNMFNGCTALTTAPTLPATTLAQDCYSYMFYGCTSLTTAPTLPATTLAQDCYSYMFYGCTNLNYIKCLATSKESNSTNWWTNNVANAGTFDCLYPTIFTKGIDGIPTGWTINYLNTNEPLKFVCKSAEPVHICWSAEHDASHKKMIKYSTDGENWNTPSVIIDHDLSNDYYDMATLQTNEVLYIKATNASYSDSTGYSNYFKTMPVEVNGVSVNGELSVEGNIMSLIDEDNYSTLTTLTSNYTFRDLFRNCKHIKYADKLQLLPTTLTSECYKNMFYGCTALTTAPVLLPATTLAQDCYYRMFDSCTSLATAPKLPATTIARYCYYSMFHGCTSLTTAPELPATTLAEECYSNMFMGCTSLTTAPELPATTLANNCYHFMFHSCTSLTTAPELPATTLANHCYNSMFENCTSLTIAPVLSATSLTSYCYKEMFNGCSNINKIYMLATDISAADCLTDWLKDTASTGKLYYDVNSITLPIDSDSGIPVGWTGIDIYSLPENKYFTLEALEDGTITCKSAVGLCPTLSKNNGEWERSEGNLINIHVKAGDVIRFKQVKDRLSTGEQDYNNTRISSTGQYKVYGNIMSLLYGDSFYAKTTFPNSSAKNYCFRGLFKNSTTLTDISNLIIPLTETADFMMAAMFENCTSITTPCKLPPVKTLSNRYEYQAMFYNCTALTTNPDLIATTGSPQCYERMFWGCTSLSSKPIIKLNNVSSYSCAEMFRGCTNINYVEIWTTYNTYSFSSWLYNTAASGYIVNITSNYIEKPSGWEFINMIYSNNGTDYYASKDYAAHVLGYESPQDAIDAGYTLQTVNNPDNNWDYYLYSAA